MYYFFQYIVFTSPADNLLSISHLVRLLLCQVLFSITVIPIRHYLSKLKIFDPST